MIMFLNCQNRILWFSKPDSLIFLDSLNLVINMVYAFYFFQINEVIL
jgi:hypothetical protein